MDSILTSIKKLRGITEEYTHFDQDLIVDINTALSMLNQIGIGPENGFRIEDSSATWQDFMGDDPRYDMVKSYIDLKVRLLFDPPLSSSVTEAINRMLSELEYRMEITHDIDVHKGRI